MIPFFRPSFSKEENDAVLRVMKSGHLTQGSEVEAFEAEFAEYIKAPYVVAVDSCTSALFLSLRYFKRNASVTCPGMTFASVAHEIVHNNNTLEFTDEYHAGEKYQLGYTDIWDCAHEVGRGMYQAGQILCFSFYPNKLLGSAEGGAIATDNKEFAEWAKLARQMGRRSRSFSDYDIEFPGWKMNMTDIQAAIAREQLKKLDEQLLDREVIASTYRNEFAQLNGGSFLYVISVPNREKFIAGMKDEGVDVSFHYKPLYDQPAYKQEPKFPYLESIKDHVVTLPLYPKLTNKEVLKIIHATKKHIA